MIDHVATARFNLKMQRMRIADARRAISCHSRHVFCDQIWDVLRDHMRMLGLPRSDWRYRTLAGLEFELADMDTKAAIELEKLP